MVRLLAALMAAVHASAWVLVSRWERRGNGAQHRVKLRAPRLIRLGFDVGLYTSLVYPVLVVIAPRWTYEGWGTWSSSIDAALQAGGLVLWMLGVAVLLWASWVMGRHLAIDGLAEDHELVTHGLTVTFATRFTCRLQRSRSGPLWYSAATSCSDCR